MNSNRRTTLFYGIAVCSGLVALLQIVTAILSADAFNTVVLLITGAIFAIVSYNAFTAARRGARRTDSRPRS